MTPNGISIRCGLTDCGSHFFVWAVPYRFLIDVYTLIRSFVVTIFFYPTVTARSNKENIVALVMRNQCRLQIDRTLPHWRTIPQSLRVPNPKDFFSLQCIYTPFSGTLSLSLSLSCYLDPRSNNEPPLPLLQLYNCRFCL